MRRESFESMHMLQGMMDTCKELQGEGDFILILKNDIPYGIKQWVVQDHEETFYFSMYLFHLEHLMSVDFRIGELDALFDRSCHTIRLSSLDIRRNRQQGFGRLLLQRVEYYGKRLGYRKAIGQLYQNTDIGVENLKTFYRKCGYQIIGNGILKTL